MMLLSQACLIHLSWPSAQRLMATRGLAQAWGRGPDSQQLEEHPRNQTPKSCLPTGAAGLIFLQQWPGGLELEAVPPSGLMLHVNTHHQGEGVPSRINRSCLLHRHWPPQRSSFFFLLRRKETSLSYGNASSLPQKSEKQSVSTAFPCTSSAALSTAHFLRLLGTGGTTVNACMCPERSQ